MESAIIGLLTTIIPIVLNFICDRMTTSEEPKPKGENDVRRLQKSDDATSVSIAFARHDDKLRKLLLKAKSKVRRPK